MLRKSYSITLGIFTLLIVTRTVMCATSDLDVTVVPTKDQFCDNDPVTVKATFKNNTNESIRVLLDINENFGLSFESLDKGVVLQSRPLRDNSGRILPTMIKSQESYEVLICLNRHLCFSETGEYNVKFSFTSSFDVKYTGSGNFKIKIVSSALTEDLAYLRKILDKKVKDKNKIRSAIEPLLFYNDLRVLPALLEASSVDPDSYPAFGGDIAESFEKFFNCEEGRNGLHALMRNSLSGFYKGIETYEKKGIGIPVDIVMYWMGNEYQSKQHRMLEYLFEHGSLEQLLAAAVLIDSVRVNSKNDITASLAKKVLAKLEKLKIEINKKP